MKRPDIAAVIPVFNPEPGLPPLCEALLSRYETVIVVDDGSYEQTEVFAALPAGIRLLRHAQNRGKGRAIKTALEWLKVQAPEVKVAVFADGDGQHRPEDVEAVAARALACDLTVLGVRDFSKQGIPFRSRFGNVLTSFLVRQIYRIPIHDTQTGLRAVPRRLFDILLETPGERYEFEMRLFGRLSDHHEKLEQVPIETIYLEDNRASHFHPLRDSFRVYRGLFSGSFFRFILSSLGGFVLDNVACSLLFLLSLFAYRATLGMEATAGGEWLCWLFALVSARCLSAFVNYQCNRVLVFGSKMRQSISLGRYAVLAVMLVALSYLGTVAVAAIFDVHGLAITIVKIAVEIFLFLMSYRIQQIWVFQATEETEFDAVDTCKRLLTRCGPFLPFLLLLVVDFSVMLSGCGWRLGWSSIGHSLLCSIVTLMIIIAIPFALRRHARWVMPVLFAWMLLVDVIELLVYNRFHMTMRGEVLAIVMSSSASEVGSFLLAFFDWQVLLLAVAVVTALVFGCRALWRHPGTYPQRPVLSYALAVVLILICLKIDERLHSRYSFSPRDVLAADVVVDSVQQWHRYSKLAEAVRNPDVSDVIPGEGNVPVFIFVIGESATRDHWQLYGYGRETTPSMSAVRDELVVFSDLLAPWAQTQEVVQMMLTRGTLEDRDTVVATMPQVLGACGYRTVLLSAQAHWGVFDSVITLLFTGCDERIYLSDRSSEDMFDHELLPDVERILREADDARKAYAAQPPEGRPDRPPALVLFVHLYGSHIEWNRRSPPEHESRAFKAARNGNDCGGYDNSIRYTDWVLGRILASLKASDCESVMVYVSDHGDTPDRSKPRVFDDQSLWHVPFIVWCSPQYRAAYPERVAALERVKDAPLQSDRLFDGLLELMNVRIKDRERESFLSPDYDFTLPRKVLNGRKVVGPKW